MKTNITISMDSSIAAQARDKGLNISSLCEDAIREILKTFKSATLPEDCDHKWSFPFSAASGLAKECLKCGEIRKVVIESYETTMKRANKTWDDLKDKGKV